MYLKDSIIIATLDGLVMQSYRQGTSQDFVLDPNAIDGWTGGTTSRRDSALRLNEHGDFPEKSTMSARVISLTGSAIASTAEDLQAMRDKMIGMLTDGEYTTLRVQYLTSSLVDGTPRSLSDRYSTVGLESTTSWVQQTDTTASWKINMFAPDPFVYGPQQVVKVGADFATGGLTYPITYPLDYHMSGSNLSTTVTNEGNSIAWPSFRITGDYFSGFTITDNQNSTVTYSGIVTMSAPVTIDMKTGTATQSGADKTTFIGRREWFGVKPSATLRPKFTPNAAGNGWCDIIIRDTWI